MASKKRPKKLSVFPDMEVLTEPEDVTLNRSSTQVDFNNHFEDIHEVIPDQNNMDGELTEPDEMEPDSYTDGSEYEDDFESSSESEATYPANVTGPDSLGMTERNLDNGIIIRYPEKYEFTLPYVSCPLDIPMRNAVLPTLKKNLDDSRIITDLYGIFDNCNSGQLVALPFPDDCTDEVRIVVTIKGKYSPHFKYFAHFRKMGNWSLVPVHMEGDVAEFEGCAFDIFFLASAPICETLILDQNGKEFISEFDSRVKIVFPQDCVQAQETLEIQITPQCVDRPLDMDGEHFIIGSTKSVHVKHRPGIFKKKMTIQLDLDLFDKSLSPNLEKYSMVDVHSVNTHINGLEMYELTSESYNRTDKGFSVRMEVEDFTSHSAQLGIFGKMVTETGKLLTRMAHGEIFHCHILVFVPPSPITYQRESIRVECVEEKRIPETLEKLSDNRYGYRELTRCRSPPIFLKDGERIRINLKGGIKLPEGFQKDQMIITFLREGLHKHVVFPAVTKFGNRPSPWAYLNFNRSDGKTIYETFFDAEFPFRKEKQKADYGASFESLPYLANRSRAVSALDINETGKTIPFSRPVSAPSDQSSRSPSIIDKTVLVLTELLSPKEWKFVLREIIDEKKEVNPDSIIEEAVANNKSDVKEAIYQSLKSWTHMYMSSCTQNQKVDEIIQRLQKKYQGIAIELEKKVKTNQAKM